MSDSQPALELPTPDEVFAAADTSSIISDLVEEIRTESGKQPDEEVILDQQRWATVANQYVGAENLGAAFRAE